MKKHINILLLSILLSATAAAQSDTLPQIKVMARALPDKIILRWAPTTPIAWQIINKYGYTIERVIMTKKNKLVKNRVAEKITEAPILPYPEEQWEKVVLGENGAVDNYAAIAAQAIYGDSFVLTEEYSNSITKVIEKAQENEKRFTFALFAADQSLKVAQAMGLFYTDNKVVEDEKYLYRIYANVPFERQAIDTGYVYIGPADYAELPRPLDFYGDFSEKNVTLSWNRELFEQIYSNYEVERSENGKDFYPLGDLPFINTAPDNNLNPRLMYRVDSLPDKNKTYSYRIKGRTIFEEWGPWSDTVSGQAVTVLSYKPAIQQPEIIDNNKVKLNWEYPADYQANIEYFSVYRANKTNGDYKAIVENLNPDNRSYTDEKPMSTNYYIIRAFDKSGNSGGSFPALAQ
ncbi:MAG: hypothetical protein P1P88_01010, partial [Bacteroidales bacterium]|nr:hypothetical protein [Bacteroidales bacterium]